MKYLGPLMLGIAGVAVLLWLGVWQLQRLEWKESVLSEIDARIGAEPVPLPQTPVPEADRYLPVSATGTPVGDPLRVLVSVKGTGAGHRLIQAFETEGRRVMLDRGFLRDGAQWGAPEGSLAVVGNLHWPDEVDSFTPDPSGDLWFARDVPAMAEELDTEPVLIIARNLSPADTNVTPLPVTSDGIPNDHLEYAITWFSLAAVWAGMTAFLLWRISRRPSA